MPCTFKPQMGSVNEHFSIRAITGRFTTMNSPNPKTKGKILLHVISHASYDLRRKDATFLIFS